MRRAYRPLIALVVLVSLFACYPTSPAVAQVGPPAVRWFYYSPDDPLAVASFKANADRFNAISPDYYVLAANGTISGDNQPEADLLAHQKKMRIFPMLRNAVKGGDFDAFLNDAVARKRAVASIAAILKNGGFDGIQLDLEQVADGSRAGLTAFVKELSVALHREGRLVTMAIPAMTADNGSAFDYPALGSLLDYACVMAYDYHWSTGDPGPIAPAGWLEQVAAYSVRTIAREKVLFGVNTYGLNWNLTSGGQAAEASYVQAMAFAAREGASSGYDAASEGGWVRYSEGGQQHEVWHENAASFLAKVATVEMMGMAGYAVWRIGVEDAAIWPQLGRSVASSAACERLSAAQASSGFAYFAETGHTLGGRFRREWTARGGIAVSGFPLSEPFYQRSRLDGKLYLTQYFERARFEFHPEAAGTVYAVQLGQLGREALGDRLPPPSPPAANTAATRYFTETQHKVSNAFYQYWRANGGLTQFGYPLSDETVVSGGDGRQIVVQYFERARFESHPESDAQPVQLSRLGVDTLAAQGCR